MADTTESRASAREPEPAPAPAGGLEGVEAVNDKNLASALLAIELGADALSTAKFAEGSMAPKVRAACWFAERTSGSAVIGSIDETEALLRGDAGTRVALDAVRTG